MKRPREESPTVKRLRDRAEACKGAMHNATDRLEYKRRRDNWRAALLTLENALR